MASNGGSGRTRAKARPMWPASLDACANRAGPHRNPDLADAAKASNLALIGQKWLLP